MGFWTIFAMICLLDCLYFKFKYTKRNGPPVWCGLPFIGYAVVALLPQFIFARMLKYFVANGPDVLITRHFTALVAIKGAYIKKVQQSEACVHRASNPIAGFGSAVTTGKDTWIFFDNGQKGLDWKTHRKINVMALYTLPKRQIFSKISDVVDCFLARVKQQEGKIWEYDNDLLFSKFQESGYINLGRTFEVNNIQSFVSAFQQLTDLSKYVYLAMLIPPIRFLVLHGNILPSAIRPRFVYRVHKELLRRILRPKLMQQGEAKDYIDAVLRVKKHDEAHTYLAEVGIFNMVATTFTSQHNTSTAMALLAANRECQQKAYEEVKSVVGSSPLSIDHLAKLHYLKAVIFESLRLSPPIPLVQRCCTETVRIGEYDMPPHLPLTMLLHTEAIDEKNFKDPSIFRPSRYLDDNGIFRNDPNFSAFSRGKRNCPGMELANMSAMVHVAKLLQHFEFVLGDEKSQLTEYNLSIFAPKQNVPLRFVARNGAPEIRAVELKSGLTALLNEVLEDQRDGKLRDCS